MKFSIVLLVAFATFAASTTIRQTQPVKVVRSHQLLERQKQILQLFDYINQHSHIPEHVEISTIYKIEDHIEKYTNPQVVTEFLDCYKNNPIRRTEIFSIFNEKHLEQAIDLFKILYAAKDYETFYKTAVWARQHINEGMFVYSLSVAVLHRPDTENLVLPPVHEVCPHYFFTGEVIQLAQYYKQIHDEEKMDKYEKDYHGYTINANYSSHYINADLWYYLEDIDMNSMHYYFGLHYPPWMNTEEYGLKHKSRGAFEYFRHQQMLARFYLERLAHKWGEIPILDTDEPIETPYTSFLLYPNGLAFPNRPSSANLHISTTHSHSCSKLKEFERRIMDVADSRQALTEDGKWIQLDTKSQKGLNILGNLIAGNKDSINQPYYGGMSTLARHLLGYSLHPLNEHRLVPSALEHLQTQHRDPVYYQMIKATVGLFRSYFDNIPPYTKKQLMAPGIEITDVKISDLITYMDTYYSDITNAVFYGPRETKENFRVRVRQQRFNHKPFEYKLKVKSDKNQKVVVKMFLGPKCDEYGRYLNLTENHLNFVEEEYFITDLTTGENIIERSSHQFDHYAPDRVPGWKLLQEVQKALEQNGELKVDYRQNWYKFPQRFMLPRGTKEGTTYQLLFFVYPFTSNQEVQEETHHVADADTKPYGYPLERVIKHDGIFDIHNAHIKEVKIVHKDLYESNLSKPQHE